MPAERRRILEPKKLLVMRHIIEVEGCEDKTLADDVETGFALADDVETGLALVGEVPKKLFPAVFLGAGPTCQLSDGQSGIESPD